MIFRTALIAATLAGTATAAQAETWRLVHREGGVFVAVDADSFSGEKTRRTARAVMAGEDAVKTGYLMITVALDCDARTIEAVDMGAYAPDGSLLREGAPPPTTSPMQEFDGTAGMGRAACDGEKLASQDFPTVEAFILWVAETAPAPGA